MGVQGGYREPLSRSTCVLLWTIGGIFWAFPLIGNVLVVIDPSRHPLSAATAVLGILFSGIMSVVCFAAAYAIWRYGNG